MCAEWVTKFKIMSDLTTAQEIVKMNLSKKVLPIDG